MKPNIMNQWNRYQNELEALKVSFWFPTPDLLEKKIGTKMEMEEIEEDGAEENRNQDSVKEKRQKD